MISCRTSICRGMRCQIHYSLQLIIIRDSINDLLGPYRPIHESLAICSLVPLQQQGVNPS